MTTERSETSIGSVRGKNSRSHSFQLCCKKFWLLNSLLPIIFRQCYSVSGECERNQYKVLPPTSIARFNFCCNLFSNYELVTGNNCRRAVLKYTIAGEGGDIPVVKHYFVEIYRSALVKRTYCLRNICGRVTGYIILGERTSSLFG